MAGKLYVVGLGPGRREDLTVRADRVLGSSDLILGYETYIDLIRSWYPDREFRATPMRKETERCRTALEEAAGGKTVALVSSGDAGIYGMAGLVYELSPSYPDAEIEVVPGITAAASGGALLGAPLMNDFCTVSLSDLLTPEEEIVRRLRGAAAGDFTIVLYNPGSRKRKDGLRKACAILREAGLPADRLCGLTGRIGREGESVELCTLDELAGKEPDMFTTVFIGNSRTKNIGGKMVTPRGYRGL